MNPNPALEFRRAAPDLLPGLTAFFESMIANKDDEFFHPHAFTPEKAVELCGYAGKDLYLVAVAGGVVLAYGMLRGWDEGYAVPSLGIAVHPTARGTGLGSAFMRYLHAAAVSRGAETIRLKVYSHNLKAKSLYEKLGYVSAGESAGQVLYTLALGR